MSLPASVAAHPPPAGPLQGSQVPAGLTRGHTTAHPLTGAHATQTAPVASAGIEQIPAVLLSPGLPSPQLQPLGGSRALGPPRGPLPLADSRFGGARLSSPGRPGSAGCSLWDPPHWGGPGDWAGSRSPRPWEGSTKGRAVAGNSAGGSEISRASAVPPHGHAAGSFCLQHGAATDIHGQASA